jgi:hypothetical protein
MEQGLNKKWLFLILPLIYVTMAIIFLQGIKRFYIGNFDPEYPYLLNATNIASGHFRVGNIEHPGTPVDCFAAIVILMQHLFSQGTELYKDVLLHPESYLFTCSIVLTILLALATLWAGIYVYRSSGNVTLALLFQAAPLFYADTIKMAICLNTESSITILGILFSAYLYVNTIGNNKPEQSTTNKNVIAFGLLTALLITTKIYCFPLVLLVFFIIEKGRQRIIYLISTALFSVVLLFPLYNQLRNWAGWIKSLVIHSGAYGQGKTGFLDISAYSTNIIDILSYHILFTLVFIIALMAFIVALIQRLRKKSNSSGNTSAIIGVVLFLFSFMLIIAKQYKVLYPDPVMHRVIVILKFYYFIPLFIFFPFILAVSYKTISAALPNKPFQSYGKPLFLIILLAVIGWGGLQSFTICNSAKIMDVAFDKTNQFLDKHKNTPLIIVTDGQKACPEVALFLGISYSGKWDLPVYNDFLEKTYPNSYLYTTYDNRLLYWSKRIDISEILLKNKTALVYFTNGNNTDITTAMLKRICNDTLQIRKTHYQKIYSSNNQTENIYQVQADSSR